VGTFCITSHGWAFLYVAQHLPSYVGRLASFSFIGANSVFTTERHMSREGQHAIQCLSGT
jgi:hypothetical protein